LRQRILIAVAHQRKVELFLPAKVEADRCLVNAGKAADLGHGRSLVALLGEERACGVDDELPCFLRPRRACPEWKRFRSG
jgi:hypothetical protein